MRRFFRSPMAFQLITIIISFIAGGICFKYLNNLLYSFFFSALLAIFFNTFCILLDFDKIKKILAEEKELMNLFNGDDIYYTFYNIIRLTNKILSNNSKDIYGLISNKIACDKLDHMNSSLISITSGAIEVNGNKEVKKYGSWLLEHANQSFFATSVIDILWHDDNGEEYLNQNILAAKRGVKITRIYMVKDCNILNDSKFKKNIDKHIENNIDVYCIPIDVIDAECRVDIGILDESMLVELSQQNDSLKGRYFGELSTQMLEAKDIKNRLLTFIKNNNDCFPDNVYYNIANG